MNMIVCSENCTHQKEGYCTLPHITQLSGVLHAACGYFQPVAPSRPSHESGRLPNERDRLR